MDVKGIYLNNHLFFKFAGLGLIFGLAKKVST